MTIAFATEKQHVSFIFTAYLLLSLFYFLYLLINPLHLSIVLYLPLPSISIINPSPFYCPLSPSTFFYPHYNPPHSIVLYLPLPPSTFIYLPHKNPPYKKTGCTRISGTARSNYFRSLVLVLSFRIEVRRNRRRSLHVLHVRHVRRACQDRPPAFPRAPVGRRIC